MSKSNLHETAYLKLVFQNIAMPNIGDALGLQPSAVAGDLFVALYTSDPTDSDAGAEATYSGYVRIPVVRSAAGWSVSGNVAANVAEVLFPVSLGTVNTITHWGIRTALTVGDLVGSGALTGSIQVDPGDTPRIAPSLMQVTEN